MVIVLYAPAKSDASHRTIESTESCSILGNICNFLHVTNNKSQNTIQCYYFFCFYCALLCVCICWSIHHNDFIKLPCFSAQLLEKTGISLLQWVHVLNGEVLRAFGEVCSQQQTERAAHLPSTVLPWMIHFIAFPGKHEQPIWSQVSKLFLEFKRYT
jgi:hypothetical protein